MSIVDLQRVRTATLARVRSAIAELDQVLKQMSLESPSRDLVVGLLKRLRANEARLKSGIHPRRTSL